MENEQMSKNIVIFNKNKRDRYKFFIKISHVIFSIVLIIGCNSKNKKSAVELSASAAVKLVSCQLNIIG